MTDCMVTVCKSCRCASCWHGEFLCQESRHADVVKVRASELLAEQREHPCYFSPEKLEQVCGYVEYLP